MASHQPARKVEAEFAEILFRTFLLITDSKKRYQLLHKQHAASSRDNVRLQRKSVKTDEIVATCYKEGQHCAAETSYTCL